MRGDSMSLADLQRAIPRRKQLLESAGYQDTALVGFEETALGERYSLVRAQFQWHFKTATGQLATVTLPSIFVVDRGGDYALVVKANQERLLEDIQETVTRALEGELPAGRVRQVTTTERGHGRFVSFQLHQRVISHERNRKAHEPRIVIEYTH